MRSTACPNIESPFHAKRDSYCHEMIIQLLLDGAIEPLARLIDFWVNYIEISL